MIDIYHFENLMNIVLKDIISKHENNFKSYMYLTHEKNYVK